MEDIPVKPLMSCEVLVAWLLILSVSYVLRAVP